MNSTSKNVSVVQNFAIAFVFVQFVVNDPENALHVFQNMQIQINNLKTRIAIMTTFSVFEIFDSSFFNNFVSSSVFDSTYIVRIIAQTITQVNQNQFFVIQFTSASVFLFRLSEKFSDIVEYDENRNKLDV